MPVKRSGAAAPARPGRPRPATPAKRRLRSASLGLTITLVAIAVALGSGLLVLWQYYEDRAMPGTYLDDIDVSGLTEAQIQAAAAAVAAQWTVTLTYDGHSVPARAADLGIVPDTAATATGALAFGRATPITQRYDRRTIKSIPLVTTVDPAVAKEFIATRFPAALTPPAEPAVVFDQATTAFTVTPGASGQTLDDTALRALLDEIRRPGNQPAAYAVPVTAAPPAVPDAAATAATSWANARLTLPLSLTHDGDTIAAFDAGTIATWMTMTVDETAGTITAGIDETAVRAYLTGTVDARLADPANVRVTLNDAAGAEVWVLEDGTPNPSIADPAAVAHDVAAALAAGQGLAEPVEFADAPPVTVPDTTTHWVDVDLSDQTATLYEGDTPRQTFTVSSGAPETPTVEGKFEVYAKVPVSTLHGPADDPYTYPDVTWQVWFYQLYGFHTAYWHDSFGTPHSHGCVNLREADAEALYDWVEVGTRVWIHA